MRFLESVLRRNSELEWMFDLDLAIDTTSKAYLKKTALETCINFIGRSISQSNFRIMKDGKKREDQFGKDWDYLLNVRPNTDQSAASFWQALIYKLILDNEVLVILSDSNDMLIADSFGREEYAVYPDVFKDVTVKDYVFKRTFEMSEVIYITYNNEKLSNFLEGLFNDYSALFTRMIETAKMSNQVRISVAVDSTQSLDEKTQSKLQKFIDKIFESIRKSPVAIFPKLKGFDYKEEHDGSNNGKSVEELAKLKRDLVNDVANILGIPTSLVHGDVAEYDTAIKAYIKFCLSPLVKKISDELNAKLLTRAEYMAGTKIEVRGIAEMNPLEVAQAIDKLRASGTFSGNDLRYMVGWDPVDDEIMDEYVLTKNYERTNAAGEGGEGENA